LYFYFLFFFSSITNKSITFFEQNSFFLTLVSQYVFYTPLFFLARDNLIS